MAQTNRAAFPADFDQMVMYGDYRRGSGGELAYALPETIEIAKSGQTLPPGTVLVLEIYNDGALTDYFVMGNGEGWGFSTSPWKTAQATGTSSSSTPGGASVEPPSQIVAFPAIRALQRTTSCSPGAACRTICHEPAVLPCLLLDLVAISLLLVALAYDWLGNTVHEIIGTVMFLAIRN